MLAFNFRLLLLNEILCFGPESFRANKPFQDSKIASKPVQLILRSGDNTEGANGSFRAEKVVLLKFSSMLPTTVYYFGHTLLWLLSHLNGKPSSQRWQYWSRMKDVVFKKILHVNNKYKSFSTGTSTAT